MIIFELFENNFIGHFSSVVKSLLFFQLLVDLHFYKWILHPLWVRSVAMDAYQPVWISSLGDGIILFAGPEG
jgi:hypothetical protein